MEKLWVFNQENENEIWESIRADLADNPFNYLAVLQQQDVSVMLQIDIDPGGGFESGIAFTSFTASLPRDGEFRFALHHQGFLDEIGKFFGMQDVELGDPAFDAAVIVKTNNEARIKEVLKGEALRSQLQTLEEFHMHIKENSEEESGLPLLTLQFDYGITNVPELQRHFHLFVKMYRALT